MDKLYCVYDKSRKGTTTGHWLVAVFKKEIDATQFLHNQTYPESHNYYSIPTQATKKLLSLVRD